MNSEWSAVRDHLRDVNQVLSSVATSIKGGVATTAAVSLPMQDLFSVAAGFITARTILYV